VSETVSEGGVPQGPVFDPSFYEIDPESATAFAEKEGYLQLAAWMGDGEAFGALARAYYPHLMRYAESSLYGIGLMCYAEDAVEGAYEHILQALARPSLEERPLPHIALFVTTTRNWIHDTFFRAWNFQYTDRYGMRIPEVQDYYYDRGPRIPGKAESQIIVLNSQERRDVAEMVVGRIVGAQALADLTTHLTQEEKELILLRYIGEQSVEETADIMGITPSRVKAIALRLAKKAHTLERLGLIDVPDQVHGQRPAPPRKRTKRGAE
jgi:RNA polymerase sigma factor (sigma-70 family)